METRSRKKKAALEENNDSNNEYLLKRQIKEDRLRSLLGPFDKYISSLECILVWDYPIVFFLFLVFLNLLFWLYTITPFYCLLSCFMSMCLFAHFFSNHIWPLLNDSEDSLDGWVKLPASSEDQFDLVRSTSNLLCTLDSAYTICEQVKTNNPQKFNVIGFLFFFFFLIISFFVNDFYFVYFLVMLLVCWPGIQHNHLPERFYNIIKPHLNSLEKALHIKKTVSKKKLRQKLGKKSTNKKKNKNEIILHDLVLSEEDSDADLEQFLPNQPDDHHPNNQLFPALASSNIPGVEDDDDDDDDAKEYLPNVNLLSDSRENTDEEFMPDMANMNDFSLEPRKVSSQEEDKYEEEKDKTKRKKKKSERKDGKKKRESKDKKGGVKDDSGSVVKSCDGALTEEMFAEGLSFDDADDIDSQSTQPIIPTLPINPALLIGGLLGQAQTVSNVEDQSGKKGGFLGKAFNGFNLFKKAVSSVYSGDSVGKGGDNGENAVVDQEFDFLQQEDLDDEEDF